MHTLRRLIILALTLATFHVSAQEPGSQQIDVSKLGPQVGAQVPDFSLPDQTETSRTLRSIMGQRGAMLVFVRSADW